MDNILKNGDDPTVNQGDQRQYRLERERERERGEREIRSTLYLDYQEHNVGRIQ